MLDDRATHGRCRDVPEHLVLPGHGGHGLGGVMVLRTGEWLRAALALLTYPPDAPVDGVQALVAGWGIEEFADFVGAAQVIFDALAQECGPERVAAVVEELRRQSFDFE